MAPRLGEEAAVQTRPTVRRMAARLSADRTEASGSRLLTSIPPAPGSDVGVLSHMTSTTANTGQMR